MVFVIIKKKLYQRKIQLVLFFVASLAVPFIVYWLEFISPGINYYTIMLQSISLIYILFVIVTDKYMKCKSQNVACVLLSVIICNFALIANKAYYIMDLNNKSNYATCVKLTSRIDQEMTSSNMKVALVGEASATGKIAELEKFELFYLEEQNLYAGVLFDFAESYIDGVIGEDYTWASKETIEDLSKSEEVKNMPIWPLDGSVKTVGDTVVVKLS